MSNMNGPARSYTIWGQTVGAPSSGILNIRAALMKSGFTWKEKRKIPGLTPGFQQQYTALTLACDKVTQARLKSCNKLDHHGNRSECGVVFCPRCMLLRRGRQTGENIKLFAHLGNDRLAFMTVLVKVITDLNDTEAIQDKFAWKIRNTIMAMRRRDLRWNNVMVKAYWEFDNLQESDELGRNATIALEQLGMPTFTFGSHWLLHFHAIVALGDITIDELKETLKRENTPHPFQVDIQPFRPHQDVNLNIQRITRYSMKFRIEDHYKRTGPFDPEYEHNMDERKWWPKESVTSLVEHLNRTSHGYQSLQFWIGAKGTSKRKTGQMARPKIDGDVAALASKPGIARKTKPVKAGNTILDMINRVNPSGGKFKS